MKVSREQAAENREKILSAASALFRERGFEGISVADLMKQVGLTHGGFYGHFESKEDLMAQACTHAFKEKIQPWKSSTVIKSSKPLAAIASKYLTPLHRDNAGSGCVIAALATDVTRQGPRVRHSVTEGLREHIESLTQMAPGATTAEKRDKALTLYSSMIGALILSRAVDEPELSREILRAVENSAAAIS